VADNINTTKKNTEALIGFSKAGLNSRTMQKGNYVVHIAEKNIM
jgi:hypothetical protein